MKQQHVVIDPEHPRGWRTVYEDCGPAKATGDGRKKLTIYVASTAPHLNMRQGGGGQYSKSLPHAA